MELSTTLQDIEGKIVLRFPYHPVSVARIKSVPGSRWSPRFKGWTVPRDRETLNMVRGLFTMQVDQRIKDWENQMIVLEQQNQTLKEDGKSSWDGFPFRIKPFPHQMTAMELLYRNKFFALLMEMGTGKTLCAINLMQRLKNEGELRPWLVVCPLSVVGVWGEQINQYSHDLYPVKLTGSRWERAKLLDTRADVYVINYEGLRILSYELGKIQWAGVICDESHRIKNRTSQQSKICYELGESASRRYILTGTMVTNNPMDCFGQFKFLNEGILGSNFFAFQNRYAVMITHGRARFPARFINLPDLANRIAPWSYRVTKESAKLGLPEKIYETRYVELPDNAKRIYKGLAKELMAEIGARVVTAPIVLTKILRFAQITAGFVTTEDGKEEALHERKVDELVDILEQVEGQCVVWTRFKWELAAVKRRLADAGVECVALSGDTAQAEREEILARFRDGLVKVFIGQVQAGGTGINLSTASTCVYMSNPFSLGDRLQSEDRLHRIGQKNNVTYIDLVCPGTIDETVVKILRNKKSMADIITGDRSVMESVAEMIGDYHD